MSEEPNLLLDTCAMIFVANDSLIDPHASREISEAAYDGRLYLSPMSAWEIGIGVAKAGSICHWRHSTSWSDSSSECRRSSALSHQPF
ncbi:hypothetical protein [Mesorhizobium sp. C268A]|uniref:hypothetical protein n=1 Tax=Mesorhizobium sp. C268A TaxID=2956826 RepID=UPI00333C4832